MATLEDKAIWDDGEVIVTTIGVIVIILAPYLRFKRSLLGLLR